MYALIWNNIFHTSQSLLFGIIYGNWLDPLKDFLGLLFSTKEVLVVKRNNQYNVQVSVRLQPKVSLTQQQ